MKDSIEFTCPYCGETNELNIDPEGGNSQNYISDCEVCCQPIQLRLTVDWDEDQIYVQADRDDT